MDSDNRAKILSHALRLFAARGYDAVGVQEIVEAAGVTKPTLYHYFGSKRRLLDALLEEHFMALYAVVEPAACYRGDLSRNLNEITAAYFRFAKSQPPFYRLLLSMYVAPPDGESFHAAYGLYRRQYELIETLFKQAAEHHGNMKGRHRRYAATFLGMINTYITLALNEAAALDDELLYKAVHQFMHGIYS
ncbi:MAG: TetR/AcrR family transcriptional regulator [Anaerolineae bacterium]|nr:TetR/AcrR family transcriptional regulator [Anaerolineae bacterium]